jgi:hypothetical protein
MIVMRHSNINDRSIRTVGTGRVEMTKGEYRVGKDFNPSGNEHVRMIKTMAAALIDYIEELEPIAGPEVNRLKALAQTHVEDAAMWAVKAATKQPME